ncbi:hypothetical protein [Nocardioides humi]|nr:hypothetical protein [Nocardioides humi]
MSFSFRLATTIAAASCALLGLSACGGEEGPTAEEKAQAEANASAASASAASASAQASRSAEQQAQYDACTTATADLRTALNDVNSRLSIGLNYQDYGDKLGDVQVAYDGAIDEIIELGGDCLTTVGKPLENAFNQYIEVKNIWSDCIGDYNCDFSEGETNRKVQDRWAKATKILDRAEENLDTLAPTP